MKSAFWALLLGLISGHATAECRQALALGLDVSGSVDAAEYRLQLDGLAAALSDSEVQNALLSTPKVPVRLMVFEWSGLYEQRQLIDWVALDTPEAIQTVISHLLTTRGAHINDPSTALGAAMLYGAQALAGQPECWAKTLDLSGDGPANVGVHPGDITDATLDDVVINGLIIGADARANTTKNLSNVKTLEDYYQSFVLRGPGAFSEVAVDYADFAETMRRKLLREIAPPALSGLSPAPGHAIQ